MSNNKEKKITLMLCTAARGGMKSVVEAYEKDGFFDKWNVTLISTHDDRSQFLKYFTFLKGFLKYIFLLTFKKVALVHAHAATRGSFWRKNFLASIARLRGVPVILHQHGAETKDFYDNCTDFQKKWMTSYFTKADKVVVLSNSWFEFVSEIAPKSHIEVLYNYVTLPKQVATSANDGIPKILFLGILGKRKGVYDLIKVAENLKASNKKFEFWVGGNGEVDKVQALVDEKNLGDCFKLLGWVSKEDYLAKADIYILPSYNEGLPMSLLEAMSWQLPVISTTVGGIPELIRDGVDGFVVEPGNITEIEAALTKLIDSEELRHSQGVNARQRVEESFSDKAVLPQLDKIYQEVGNWS